MGPGKEQLSGASRTEPGIAIIPCNNCYSGEFLTAATPGKTTVMRSDSADLLGHYIINKVVKINHFFLLP
jgi:hypothetical protein